LKLAPRFVLALGLLATTSTAVLGLVLRQERATSETARFQDEGSSACRRASTEVRNQADTYSGVLAGACSSGELVDRTLLAMEAGELDERRVALAALIPGERKAFGLDELVLVTGDGVVLGADPPSLLAASPREITQALAVDPAHFVSPQPALGSSIAAKPSLVSRCRRDGRGRASVGLIGARHLDPLVAHIGETMGISVKRGEHATTTEQVVQAECLVDDGHGGRVSLLVSKDTSSLHESLDAIDQKILEYSAFSIAVALLFAIFLSRNLSRPLSKLASEAQKVASGEARPVPVRGSGEVADLTRAFDRMLDDLAATRRRLAATTRVAAWREVARRVAHEVKNPLAPIRAAVETLRRLRAREDPAFDGYFDEATRTVLDEVKRISDIVTEFTRFARLPPPKPQQLDLRAVVKDVVQLHEPAATASGIALRVEAPRGLPRTMADRDQIVQVLTNLVQNAIDALRERGKGEVVVALEPVGADRVAVSVRDDGPGVATEMVPRLFEPYATSKEHGTGLGLAIAQRIAIEHGGELSYVERPRGAEFRMVLPLEGPPPVSEMPPGSG